MTTSALRNAAPRRALSCGARRLAFRGLATTRWQAPTQAQDQALLDWLDTLTTTRVHERDVVGAQKVRQMAHTLPLPVIPDVSEGAPLPPAWHLMLFPPEHELSTLGHDGAERGAFFPNEAAGTIERMWASGSMAWSRDNPLRVGQETECETSLDRYEVKEGKRGKMIFTHQKKVISNASGPCLTEIRVHMYRRPVPPPSSPAPTSPAASSPTVPPKAPFVLPSDAAESTTLVYVPSMPQLFRFSALTFNSHRIHYDRKYCQELEHRPDCVVHGPMTALLLTTTVASALPPTAHLASLKYRATSPLYVDRPVKFQAYKASEAQEGQKWPVWAEDDQGNLAMSGEVTVAP